MDIRQKAKRYDEAIKMAKEFLMSPRTCFDIEQLYDIFPELRESEDEKVRKAIIDFFSEPGRKEYILNGFTIDTILAWLEKQGEKPINDTDEEIVEAVKDTSIFDMVEPKFKVGDWVVDKSGLAQQVLDFRGGIYTCTYNSFTTDSENNYHLWTIRDAKDGDILMANAPFIFNGNLEGGIGCPGAHCAINTLGKFQIPKYPTHWTGHTTTPATKEQRDTLMKAMADAGYTFDFEKKELKKIEQEPLQWNISDYKTWQYIVSDVLTKHDGIGQYLDDGFCKKIAQYMQEEWSKKLSLGQNLTWSEEDDYNLQCCIAKVNLDIQNGNVGRNEELIDWLECLRNRVKPQPDMVEALRTEYEKGRADTIAEMKKDWSKEDEKRLNRISDFIWKNRRGDTDGIYQQEQDVNWLKSIKDRVQPKKEWSDDDEKFFKTALWHISYSISNGESSDIHCDTTEWFKSLKDRVQPQPKQEWSEEVEDAISLLKHIAEEQEKDYCPHNANDLRKAAKYLETCRPQNTWKPSEEQMDALKKAIDGVIGDVLNWHSKDRNLLDSLYTDLKKLKDEK